MSTKHPRLGSEECSSMMSTKRLCIETGECYGVSLSSSSSSSSSLSISSPSTWSNLPADMWGGLLEFLSAPEYYRMEAICRPLRHMLQSPVLVERRKQTWALRIQHCLFQWLELKTTVEQDEFADVMHRSGAVFSGGSLLCALLYGDGLRDLPTDIKDDPVPDRIYTDNGELWENYLYQRRKTIEEWYEREASNKQWERQQRQGLIGDTTPPLPSVYSSLPREWYRGDLDFYVPASSDPSSVSPLVAWIETVWVPRQRKVYRKTIKDSGYGLGIDNGVTCSKWETLDLQIDVVHIPTATVCRILDAELSPPSTLPPLTNSFPSEWKVDSSGFIRLPIPGMCELISRAHYYDTNAMQPLRSEIGAAAASLHSDTITTGTTPVTITSTTSTTTIPITSTTDSDRRAILGYIAHGYDFSPLHNALCFRSRDTDKTHQVELCLLADKAIRLHDCRENPVPPLERGFWQRFFLTLFTACPNDPSAHTSNSWCTECHLRSSMRPFVEKKLKRIRKYQARGFPCTTHERFLDHVCSLIKHK